MMRLASFILARSFVIVGFDLLVELRNNDVVHRAIVLAEIFPRYGFV